MLDFFLLSSWFPTPFRFNTIMAGCKEAAAAKEKCYLTFDWRIMDDVTGQYNPFYKEESDS